MSLVHAQALLDPPVVTHISNNQILNAGSSVTLNCSADGNPPPVISWTRVSDNSAVIFPLTDIGQLDEGAYRCTAYNGVGSVVTRDSSVFVHFPPSIEPLEERKVVIRGESLTLFCNVSGKPAPVVFWTHVESNDKLSNSKWEIKFATERDVGRYRCNATNIYGHASDTIEILLLQTAIPFSTTVSSNTGMLNKDAIYGPVIGIMGLIVISALIYLNQGFQNESGNNGEREIPVPRHYMELGEVTEFPGESAETGTEASPDLEINEYAPLHPATRSWEVPRENVTIEKVIGKGSFGQVAQATASELRGRHGTTRVAIKMLKDNACETDREDLMSELEVMKKLKPHPHVIKLMGCVTESDPILVIIEYVPYGDLLGYLRRSRGLNDTYFKDPDVKPQTSLTSQQLMKFSWHVAEGMRYLSSKNIIHRDLAARNVLVGEQEVCKVTDFGMARVVNQEKIYQKKSEGRIPVKWTASEALLHGLYTTKSDVWSFGVVLYEIFTVGGSPYPRTEGMEMYSLLADGYRMPKPSHVDDTLYQIMLSCWQDNPDNRPTFELLGSELKKMENQHKRLINMNDYDKKLYENV
ncbi:unnamed protein product [Porites lobata]|uniref:receptor protein-tyrosine kinase n=1 Tax=Porites lobata TaxID=104759 RepID=A0ABN8RZQ0_9CNID|nr:unnamed protein product [Porites lobata]